MKAEMKTWGGVQAENQLVHSFCNRKKPQVFEELRGMDCSRKGLISNDVGEIMKGFIEQSKDFCFILIGNI